MWYWLYTEGKKLGTPSPHPYHVIGFSDLVDLWVITIKKPMILCVRSRWRQERDQVTSVQNAEQAARTYESFVYSIVTITRLYDYQTWQTHFGGILRGAQRYMGFFSGLCWLAEPAKSDHMAGTAHVFILMHFGGSDPRRLCRPKHSSCIGQERTSLGSVSVLKHGGGWNSPWDGSIIQYKFNTIIYLKSLHREWLPIHPSQGLMIKEMRWDEMRHRFISNRVL